MPTLLKVDSSPLGDASISRHLTQSFVEKWKTVHPAGQVLIRDLTSTPLQPLTAAWIANRGAREDSYSDEQRDLLSLSDALIDELKAADEYVFGVPMHNFGVPATLKLWIDQIARPGRTFSYAGGQPKGLLEGKRATFMIASGGMYDAGTAMASFNFVEPYLRAIFGFMGVSHTTFISAGGSMAVAYGKIDRETFLRPQMESIERLLPA